MPRSRSTIAARAALAGLALTAVSLAAATPAAAHTNNLYTFALVGDAQAFSTVDRTNANVTLLPTASTAFNEAGGAEVFNEVGTAVGAIYEPYGFVVVTWNHDTGATESPVPITLAGAAGIDAVYGLDTRTDGTLLTFVNWEVNVGSVEFPELEDHAAIATLDRTSGALTEVVDLGDLVLGDEAMYEFASLATDPISGQTFVFLRGSEGTSYYVLIDPVAHTHGAPTQFVGTGFESGFFLGADFDHDGTLYFAYGNNEAEQYELSTLPAPSTWPTATRTSVAPFGYNAGIGGVDYSALTLEHTPPALAETGSEFAPAWLVAGLVAILGGALVMVRGTKRTAR